MKIPTFKRIIFKNIEIILVSPQVPENIGLVARVLKNTSFFNLKLVNPNLTSKSYEVAKRAKDILRNVQIFKDLQEATSNSNFVFGTTRRSRQYKFIYNFNDIKHLIIAESLNKKVSIVFGREDFGLLAEDIELCDSIFYIPANPEFSSYNLSFSVGIVCYELFNLIENLYCISKLDLAKKEDIYTLFEYIKEKLSKRIKKDRLEPTMLSLKRIALRTHLTKSEVALLKSLILD
ncbi:MAG: TrmJ/YjtD family RNA methyltransferase [Candidatus Omnitrophica bacterium]|nr:TrmJ/YjtD family RNA methyltransferase [Candidatus Omnitrophota bacterium]